MNVYRFIWSNLEMETLSTEDQNELKSFLAAPVLYHIWKHVRRNHTKLPIFIHTLKRWTRLTDYPEIQLQLIRCSFPECGSYIRQQDANDTAELYHMAKLMHSDMKPYEFRSWYETDGMEMIREYQHEIKNLEG